MYAEIALGDELKAVIFSPARQAERQTLWENIKQSEIELLLKTNGKQANKLLLMTVDDNGNVYTVRKASTK